jgi:hypothetical protein
MTKKHFIAIAALFKANRPADSWDACKRVQHNLLLDGLVAIMVSDNPRFDRGRFLKACGGFAAD